MATFPNESANAAPRRVVLIDFDWRDADLIPALLRRADLAVRLVAGERSGDGGLRVAELCGLPHTLDLADLTREIFDLALVGEGGSRRTQIESLLLALGTPCRTPQEFLRGEPEAAPEPAIDAPLAMHAAAFERALGGGTAAIPGAAELAGGHAADPGPTSAHDWAGQLSMADFPSPEARERLETTLGLLASAAGAGSAEFHAGMPGALHLVAAVGPEDKLLRGLVDLAQEMGTPQVVTRASDPGKGRAWGAWPFRTAQRQGVLAAAAIEPAEGPAQWQGLVAEIRDAWDREDQANAGAAFPLVPARESGWLSAEAFGERVALATERHRRDGLRFELHRIDVPGSAAAETWCAWLPWQVRDTDCLARPTDTTVLLLVAGGAGAFASLRERLLALWASACRETGGDAPVPALVDQHVALESPEGESAFAAAAAVWLASS